MKKNIIKTLLLIVVALCVFSFVNIKNVSAENIKLSAGKEITITNCIGSLENINIRIEFTSFVNLDGTNNALLVGITASDGTLLTDTRFIGSSTKMGLFDAEGVALLFENPPSTIGKKSISGSNYTYVIETRDFKVVNGKKNIGKLVVVAQKGEEITSQISFSEVKYSVKFGNGEETLYSYNEIVTAPTGLYSFDIDGHREINVWKGDDSFTYISGTTRATKDIVYTGFEGEKAAHNWIDVKEVKGKRGVIGTKAHQTCSVCDAKRLNSSSLTLVTDEDLKQEHTCSYQVNFNWNNAKDPGDKPVVTYTCTEEVCSYCYILKPSEITIYEKEGSRVPATFDSFGSVVFIASCSYEGQNASDEKTYVLPKTPHALVYHASKEETCTEDGNIAYYECTDCHKKFSDAAGTIEITDIVIPKHHTLVHYEAKTETCTEDGNIAYYECSVCHKRYSDKDGKVEITNVIISKHHTLTHHEAKVETCTEDGNIAYYECSVCHKKFSDENGTKEIDIVIIPKHHTLVHYEAKTETCTEDGNIAYYGCSVCHKKFSDENGIKEISNVVILKHHTLTYHEAKDETCTEDGNVAHYECSVCHRKYADRDGNIELTNVVKEKHHTLVFHQKEDETCTKDGSVEHYECSVCHKMFTDVEGVEEILDITIPKHHILTKIDAVAATCTTIGNIEYYHCNRCDKNFDTDGNEIENPFIPSRHSLVKINGKAETCTEDGQVEHYHCNECGKNFSDEEATIEIKNIVISKHHTLTRIDAVAATCTTIGNIEYYHCSRCDKNFNIDGEEIEDPFIPYKHTLVKYNAKDVTCDRDGNVEYYHCNDCGKNFSNKEGTMEITETVIPSVGHQYGEDGRCIICGKTDPDYSPGFMGCKSSTPIVGSFLFIGLTILFLRKKKRT